MSASSPSPRATAIRIAQRRLRICLAAVLVGSVAIIVGVAEVYWPAAVIIAGIALVAGGLLLVNVAEPAKAEERKR